MDLSALKALILAGGLGTRLRTIAPDNPKGLVDVAGKPFLEYQLLWLREQGLRQVVFCLGYRAEPIMAYFAYGRAWGMDIQYSVESEPLGTAGALRLAWPHLTAAFVAMNGDTYYTDPLLPLLEKHRAVNAQFTIALSAAGPRAAAGQIVLAPDGRITQFTEKDQASSDSWLNAGLYIIEPEFLSTIPTGRTVSLEREILPQQLAAGTPIYGLPLPNGYLDIGVPAGYRSLVEHLRRRQT
jgi:NDP-sugar pyrophosphorylase family protein